MTDQIIRNEIENCDDKPYCRDGWTPMGKCDCQKRGELLETASWDPASICAVGMRLNAKTDDVRAALVAAADNAVALGLDADELVDSAYLLKAQWDFVDGWDRVAQR